MEAIQRRRKGVWVDIDAEDLLSRPSVIDAVESAVSIAGAKIARRSVQIEKFRRTLEPTGLRAAEMQPSYQNLHRVRISVTVRLGI
jgi:hypothetical protein